ncbi:MAG: YnbE family lipoprotein [Sphingomonadales bacterium]|nr:YnbE family lipoprotein [Sphingomonadales bacterium]
MTTAGGNELGRKSGAFALSAMVLSGALSGCVSVSAPDKPIVIELNMNIKMDVVYKLSGDAANTVDSNKEIF